MTSLSKNGNASKQRVIFIVQSYFQKWDEDRLGIRIFEKHDVRVEIWEVFPLTRPQYTINYSPPDPSDYINLRRFNSRKTLIDAINQLNRHDRILPQLSRSFLTDRIIRRCKARGAKIGYIAIRNPGDIGKDLVPLAKAKTLGKLLPYLRSFDLLYTALYVRLSLFLKNIPPYDFIIACGGEKSLEVVEGCFDCSTEIIWTHQLDYDVYREIHGSRKNSSENYWVFLDQYIPYHPDQVDHVDPVQYYAEMNSSFDQLEKATGIPVCIAAHPRTTLQHGKELWNGRRCLRGKTGDLVRNSYGILAHYSVSITLAILFHRRAVFLIPTSLRQTRHACYIHAMSVALGQEPVTDIRLYRTYTETEASLKARYDNYIAQYIKKPGTPDGTVWDVVCRKWYVV